MKVTVIMPAFNEEMTARIMIERVLDQRCVGQVIFVDDASSDDTYQIVSTIRDKRLVRIKHEKNMGKGSAIRTASQHVACDIVLIQDADLEYSPEEYLKLITGSLLRLQTKLLLFGSVATLLLANLIAELLFPT